MYICHAVWRKEVIILRPLAAVHWRTTNAIQSETSRLLMYFLMKDTIDIFNVRKFETFLLRDSANRHHGIVWLDFIYFCWQDNGILKGKREHCHWVKPTRNSNSPPETDSAEKVERGVWGILWNDPRTLASDPGITIPSDTVSVSDYTPRQKGQQLHMRLFNQYADYWVEDNSRILLSCFRHMYRLTMDIWICMCA